MFNKLRKKTRPTSFAIKNKSQRGVTSPTGQEHTSLESGYNSRGSSHVLSSDTSSAGERGSQSSLNSNSTNASEEANSRDKQNKNLKFSTFTGDVSNSQHQNGDSQYPLQSRQVLMGKPPMDAPPPEKLNKAKKLLLLLNNPKRSKAPTPPKRTASLQPDEVPGQQRLPFSKRAAARHRNPESVSLVSMSSFTTVTSLDSVSQNTTAQARPGPQKKTNPNLYPSQNGQTSNVQYIRPRSQPHPLGAISETYGSNPHPRVEPLKVQRVPLKNDQDISDRRNGAAAERRPRSFSADSVLSYWDGAVEGDYPPSPGELKMKTFSEADIHNSSTLMVSEENVANNCDAAEYADSVGLHIISDTHFHRGDQYQDLLSKSVENIPNNVQRSQSDKSGKLYSSKSYGNLTDFSGSMNQHLDSKELSKKMTGTSNGQKNPKEVQRTPSSSSLKQNGSHVPHSSHNDDKYGFVDKMSVHVISDTHLHRQYNSVPQSTTKSNSLSSTEPSKGSRTSPDGVVGDVIPYQPSQDPSGTYLDVDKVSLQIISDTNLHHSDSLRSNTSSRPSVQKRSSKSANVEKVDSFHSQSSRSSRQKDAFGGRNGHTPDRSESFHSNTSRTSGKQSARETQINLKTNIPNQTDHTNSTRGSTRMTMNGGRDQHSTDSLQSRSSQDSHPSKFWRMAHDSSDLERRVSGASDSKSRPVTPKSSFSQGRGQTHAFAGIRSKSRSMDNLLDSESPRFTTFQPQHEHYGAPHDFINSPRPPPRRKRRNRQEGLDSDSGASLLDSSLEKPKIKSVPRYQMQRHERNNDILSSSDYASDSSVDVRQDRKARRVPSFNKSRIPEIRYQELSDSDHEATRLLPSGGLDLTGQKMFGLQERLPGQRTDSEKSIKQHQVVQNAKDWNGCDIQNKVVMDKLSTVFIPKPARNGKINDPVRHSDSTAFTSTPVGNRTRSATTEGLSPSPDVSTSKLAQDRLKFGSVPNLSTTYSTSLPGLHPEDSSILVEEDYLHQSQDHMRNSLNSVGLDSKDSDLSFSARPEANLQDVESWNSDQVIEWCRNQGFPQLAHEFDGLNVTGQQLLTITEEDLVDLGIDDPVARQHILDEVKALRLPASSPHVWRLQTSMKRRTLETSGDLIKDRLYNLQELNSQQQARINTSLQEMQEQQRLASELLQTTQDADQGSRKGTLDRRMSASVEVLNLDSRGGRGLLHRRSSTGDALALAQQLEKLKKVALRLWSAEDVQVWLKAVGLEKFAETFATHDIAGRNLAEINMRLFDKINIESVEDRELILAKLYELQHPEGPSLEEIFKTPDTDAMPIIPRSKAKVAPDGSTPGQEKKTGFHKKLFSEKPKECGDIQVWHELTGMFSHTTVRILESTTSSEVLNAILSENEVSDDYNLYKLVDVPLGKDNDVEQELGKFECPLSTQRLCRHNSCQLQIKKDPGRTIKVICKMTGVEPRGKVFSIATTSSCNEVLQVALRKFQLRNADPTLFRLMEIDKDTGDVRLLTEDEVIVDLRSDSFVLCAGDDMEELSNLENLPTEQPRVRRSSSLSSHGSSGASQVSGHSSLEMAKPRQEKLENLEAQMASIEAALANNPTSNSSALDRTLNGKVDDQISSEPTSLIKSLKKTARPTSAPLDRYVSPRKQAFPSNSFLLQNEPWNDEQLELLREIALLKESINERDSTIDALRSDNERLTEKANQVVSLQKHVSEMEEELGNRELLWQAQFHDMEQELLRKETEAHHKAQKLSQQEEDPKLASLERQLRGVEEAVRDQERSARSVQNQLQQAQEEDSSPERGMFRIRELERELSSAESQLLKMKQKHAELYGQLELARKEHEKHEEQIQSQPENTLFDFLFGTPPQLIAYAEVKVTDAGWGFMVGRDRERRPVIKHVESGRPLRKGDRLMEIDGKRVYDLEDGDIQRALRQSSTKMKLVVLRDVDGGPFTDSEASEVESLKEDLSIAVMELESVQQDNQELNHQLKKVENIKLRLHQEKALLESKFEDLTKKLANSPGFRQDSTFDISFEKQPDAKKRLRFGDDFGSHNGSAVNGIDPPEGKVIAYEYLDDHVPLWESLQGAPKDAVLQVLKDHILETSQQKAYLDSLLAAVIDHAPGLLDRLESPTHPCEPVLLPYSEEFC